MRYSLLSRFRGTLLGAALGETFGSQDSKIPQLSTSWGKMMILSAESLLRLGKFDVEDWRKCLSWESPDQNVIDHVHSGAIIATLPVILFSHEYKAKLRQNLQQVVTVCQDDPQLRDGVLAVGYAIAQSLREKLNPSELVAKILIFLEDSETPFVHQLTQVQTLLKQGAGLESAVHQLSRPNSSCTPVALAFYCFLSTLEDFDLSVTRAARTGYQPQITCAITGALSGAYNSTAGIPVKWSIATNQPNSNLSGSILPVADRLLAVWSGVYAVSSADPIQRLIAVAAPRVIQPR